MGVDSGLTDLSGVTNSDISSTSSYASSLIIVSILVGTTNF
jgi:hypothetical protein